jgi:sugar phosphate isomerase/epimerase
MRLGCVTYNVLKDMTVDEILRILEATGFEAVELRTQHKHGVEPSLSAEEREKVRRKFEGGRVRLLSFGTTCEFHSPDPAVRKQNIETAKKFVELAHDTGAWGVKVRPNGLPQGIPRETTIANIGAALRELGDFGALYGVEIWMEVHGRETSNPPVAAAILKAANHPNVGACWNSNATDVVNNSVKPTFDLLKPYLKSAHINELPNEKYPYREFFALLKQARWDRYTLCECQESKEPERFLRYYHALWKEMTR